MAKKTAKPFKPMWEIKQQATEPGVLDLYIYGDVEAETWVDDGSFWGSWKEAETSANHFREVLAEYPDAREIRVYINSRGGSVFEGTAIYNQLRRHPARKVVYIDGFACSIASVIAMAGDEVVMPRNALMMIHNMWMEVTGNAEELRKAADDLDTINDAGRAAYLLKAGAKLREDELAEMMAVETWLTAEDCIRLGLADRYAEQDADMSGAAEVLQRANLNLQQRLNLQRDLAAQLRQLTRRDVTFRLGGAPEKTGKPSTGPQEAHSGPETPPGDKRAAGTPPEGTAGREEGETGENSVMALLANLKF